MIAAFSDLDERALKTATGDLVDAAGGAKRVSEALGKIVDGDLKPYPVSRVSEFCTLSDMERSMPIRFVTKLEVRTGLPIVSKAMFERITCDGTGSSGVVCVQDLCRIVRETSDLNSVMSECLADNHVDSADRAAIRTAIVDLRRELDALEAKVRQP